MSKLGTAILGFAVLALGLTALFLGLHAASQPFAIHMGIFAAACALFLFFILRRARVDQAQG
jgi:hypothetical protein